MFLSVVVPEELELLLEELEEELEELLEKAGFDPVRIYRCWSRRFRRRHHRRRR